ncbi:MAG: alginate export family protein [Ignavibacteria bacterium]|nr:alginate export family protein [Ignavibacteria bacterium]
MKNFSEKVALIITYIACACIFAVSTMHAQFSINGQLVTRAEFRNGYGVPLSLGADPTFFVSQRLRLEADYKLDILNIFASVQDIRTWGNTSQLNIYDALFSVHEAWGELDIDSTWKVKIGRQELTYDNSRFWGNVDWALQARSHDFLLVKMHSGNTSLHFGGGFNQNYEPFRGVPFISNNQYKTAQMLWLNHNTKSFNASMMFWNNGLQNIVKDSTGLITYYDIRYMQTLGLSDIRYSFDGFTLSGFYYHQFGSDLANRTVSAFDASAQISHEYSIDAEELQSMRATAGFELLSGTSNTDQTKNSSYSPLYGTNHMHNGYMDLFYVGGRHENSVGLLDVFLRLRYDHNKRFFSSLNIHSYSSAADFVVNGETLNRTLGTEIDVTLGYVFHDAVSVQFGYSQLFAPAPSMPYSPWVQPTPHRIGPI